MSVYWLKRYYKELSYDSVCIKWIDEANNTKLRKSTGSIRTQYPIERMLWRLFDYEMKIHESRDVKQSYFPNRVDEWEEEKNRIYKNMRKVLLTVNQIINDREAEKIRMAEEEEQERQRIKTLSNAAIKATRAARRQERKMEAQQKIESGDLRRSRRVKNL
tara:strand:+ start:696 stop:1178 length:483 start_codon:yes stop_codon:yes gene_type:complete